jgi:hypothetical protein
MALLPVEQEMTVFASSLNLNLKIVLKREANHMSWCWSKKRLMQLMSTVYNGTQRYPGVVYIIPDIEWEILQALFFSNSSDVCLLYQIVFMSCTMTISDESSLDNWRVRVGNLCCRIHVCWHQRVMMGLWKYGSWSENFLVPCLQLAYFIHCNRFLGLLLVFSSN